jgi:hypothetical protein
MVMRWVRWYRLYGKSSFPVPTAWHVIYVTAGPVVTGDPVTACGVRVPNQPVQLTERPPAPGAACGNCLDHLARVERFCLAARESQTYRPEVIIPCSTPSSPTATPPARPVPLKTLSVGDLADLLVAFAAGEVSEGFLRDVTGLPGDTVRALWFDAIERAKVISDAWLSKSRPPGGTTPDPPASSGGGRADPGSSGPGPTG